MTDLENKIERPLFITIGSNINPEKNLDLAISALENHFGNLKISRIYETKAVLGPQSMEPQDNYLNAAVLTKCSLEPSYIKFEILRNIEDELLRTRTTDKFISRTIDLDIAIYGSLIVNAENIEIPDPDIELYAHVTYPLRDLDPTFIHPTLNLSLSQIASKLEDKNIRLFSKK